MVDILALTLSHGLLLLAVWRLLWRDELDQEGEPAPRRRPRRGMVAPSIHSREDHAQRQRARDGNVDGSE